ncbi:MAG: hypothetical protein KC996_06760 [Phycisphaerales bacterium]|nr:hypothetical protein [Phycisphaerales bacterium]
MPTEISRKSVYTHQYPSQTPDSMIRRDEERIHMLASLIGTHVSTDLAPSKLRIHFSSTNTAAFIKWMLLGGTDPGKAERLQQKFKHRSQRSIDYTTATLCELIQSVTPLPFPDILLSRIKEVLHDAQLNPPQNGTKFAKEVNELLDLCGLKLVSHGKTTGRVRCTKRNYLYISFSSNGCRGFQNTDFDLIPQHQQLG